MTPLNSSVIQSADYDQASKRLTLTFKSGASYNYTGVSLGDFEGLTRAESAGKFFHEVIKPTYGDGAKAEEDV